MSPQQFIASSGLNPSARTHELYLSLASHVITNHGPVLVRLLQEDPTTEVQASYWLAIHEVMTGATSPDKALTLQPMVHAVVTTSNVGRLDKKLYHRTLATQYANGTSTERDRYLTTVFLNQAFHLLSRHDDTAAVLAHLREMADIWIAKQGPDDIDPELAREQLLATACFAHPNHFINGGFGLLHLTAPHDGTSMFASVQDMLCGPVAYLSRNRERVSIQPRSGTQRVFDYAQRLDSSLSLDSLVVGSKLSNAAIPCLVRNHGKHIESVDQAILTTPSLSPLRKRLLSSILASKVAGKYSVESLVSLLKMKIDLLPLRTLSGEMEGGSGDGFVTKEQISRERTQCFDPAYEQNPNLKRAIADVLKNLDGITIRHLQLTGISVDYDPELVDRMHLKDRAQLFTTELGV